MRVSTIVMLLGAAVCATAAAFLTRAWLGRPDPPATVIQQTATAATRTLVVASAPLKFGTALAAEHIKEVPWPAEFFPTEAFASKDVLLAGGQRIVLSSIAKNEPILASRVTGPGQRASLSVMIDEGKKAVTIRVDDVLGVAGFVQPDDRVDVLLTRNDKAAGASRASGTAYTDVLLQNVRVLAIDQLAERNTQAKPVKAVTLEVETNDAQKLVLAASVGQLSLTLRRAGWAQTSQFRRIGLEDLPSSQAPEAPQTAPAEEAPDPGPRVTVIRGTERAQYNVTNDSEQMPLGGRSTTKSAASRAGQVAGEDTAPQSQPR
jgi:pilus assembly protein CpaB